MAGDIDDTENGIASARRPPAKTAALPLSLSRNSDYLRFLAWRCRMVGGFQMLSVAVGRDIYTAAGNPMDLALVFGASIMVFGLSRNYLLLLSALMVYGAVDIISVYVRQTLIQLGTPDNLRGRVNSVNSVTINTSNQLGDFRAEAMAAMLRVPAAVAIGGALTTTAAAIWYRWLRSLRGLAIFEQNSA